MSVDHCKYVWWTGDHRPTETIPQNMRFPAAFLPLLLQPPKYVEHSERVNPVTGVMENVVTVYREARGPVTLTCCGKVV